MTGTRKRRGAETQTTVARWLAEHGWPYAESAGAGRTGSDITGVPGLAIEVKARRDFTPLAWIRQARTGKGLPFVIFRPDGMGPKSVAEWPVLIPLEDFTALLHAAGYGSCPACDEMGAPAGHTPYLDPQPGDDFHGQYDPSRPQDIDRALGALDD